jgi:hypothetical protein
MLPRVLATCDQGVRDRALLLFGFAGRAAPLGTGGAAGRGCRDPRRWGAAAPHARKNQSGGAGGLRSPCPAAACRETCPLRAFEAWQAVARRKAGPLFRKVSTGGGIDDTALHPGAVRRILVHRIGMAGLTVEGVGSAECACAARRLHHRGLRKGVRDGDIMRHTPQS